MCWWKSLTCSAPKKIHTHILFCPRSNLAKEVMINKHGCPRAVEPTTGTRLKPKPNQIHHFRNAVVFAFILTFVTYVTFFWIVVIKPVICLAGVTGICCDIGGMALLEPIRVVSFALLGSLHLKSVEEDAV